MNTNEPGFCHACGAALLAGAMFCTACGAPTPGAAAQPAAPAFPNQPPLSQPPPVPPPPVLAYHQEFVVNRRTPEREGVMGIIKEAYEFAGSNRLMFFVLVLAYGGLMGIGGMVPFLGPLIQMAMTGPLSYGFYKTVLDAYDGQPLDIGKLFSGFQRFGESFVVYLMTLVPAMAGGLVIVVVCLPFLIPALPAINQLPPNAPPAAVFNAFKPLMIPAVLAIPVMVVTMAIGAGFGMAYGVLVDDPAADLSKAIGKAWRITKTCWPTILGLHVMTGLLSLACLIVVCVGWVFLAFWLAPAMALCPALLYRYLASRTP